MKLSGHLTASVFRRYDIHDDSDLEAAAAQLDAVAGRPKPSKPERVVKFMRTAQQSPPQPTGSASAR